MEFHGKRNTIENLKVAESQKYFCVFCAFVASIIFKEWPHKAHKAQKQKLTGSTTNSTERKRLHALTRTELFREFP
jgi:hypothetical protein